MTLLKWRCGANHHAILTHRSKAILVLLCLTQAIAHRIVSGIHEAGSTPIQAMIECRVKGIINSFDRFSYFVDPSRFNTLWQRAGAPNNSTAAFAVMFYAMRLHA